MLGQAAVTVQGDRITVTVSCPTCGTLHTRTREPDRHATWNTALALLASARRHTCASAGVKR